MRVRAQRTHFMGSSNRDKDDKLSGKKDVFEKSYVKSQSFYSQHQQQYKQGHQSDRLNKPFIGTNNELQTKRFNRNNFNRGKIQTVKLGSIQSNIDLSSKLNQRIKDIKEQFINTKINMHKLNQLKQTFIKNNQNKRNLREYFQKFANSQQKIGINEMKEVIKQYGYDVNDEQVKLMFKLTNKNTESLNINEFINLMTKQNIYFRTLKFQNEVSNDNNHSQLQSHAFSAKNHQILRNKFFQLKQAFNIYKQRDEEIDENKFQYVMKKLGITDLIMLQSQRKQLFKQFSNEKGNFNVEKLMCTIAQQQKNRISRTAHKIENSFDDNIKVNEELKNQKQKKLKINSLKNMSNLQYENRFTKANEILITLRKMNQKGNKNVMQALGDNLQFEKYSVIDRIQLILQNQGYNFNKSSYEALGGYLEFNKDDQIMRKDLQRIILKETDLQAMQRFERKTRNPPPISNECNSTQCYPKQAEKSIERIKNLRMNPQMKTLFNEFDLDKDGYVSKQDLESKLKQFNVLEEWQVNNLKLYLNASEGCLNFDRFVKQFSQEQKNQISLQLKTNSMKSNSCSLWQSTRKNIIKQSLQSKLQRPSKYTAWPTRLHQHDLSMLQPNDKSGMHMSDIERMNTMGKVNYGREDKLGRQKIYHNRLKKITNIHEQFKKKVQQNNQLLENRDEAQKYFLRLTKEKYEANCHQIIS